MSAPNLINAIRQGIAAHESLDLAEQRVREELRFRDPVRLHQERKRLTRAQERAAEADRGVARELGAWIRPNRCVCAVTPGVPCSGCDL